MYFSTKNYLKNNYYHIVKHTTDKHPILLIYSINYIYCPQRLCSSSRKKLHITSISMGIYSFLVKIKVQHIKKTQKK